MSRRLTVAVGVLAALGLAAPSAHADHVAPSVSATLTLGNTVKLCGAAGQFCARGRRATIAWDASCGPAAPADALESVDISIVGIRPSGRRFTFAAESLDDPQLSGSLGMTAEPGLRFTGEVDVTCRVTTFDVDGNPLEHGGTATATTAEFYLRPQVVAARTTRASFCGIVPPTSKVDRWLQAGEYAELAWIMRYSGTSLMKPGVPPLRQIKLFARGAGVRLKRSPDRSILRQYDYLGTWLTPRRGGTLRIWATIGGHRTNTLRVKVLPKRC